jgi:hypothetical protein
MEWSTSWLWMVLSGKLFHLVLGMIKTHYSHTLMLYHSTPNEFGTITFAVNIRHISDLPQKNILIVRLYNNEPHGPFSINVKSRNKRQYRIQSDVIVDRMFINHQMLTHQL